MVYVVFIIISDDCYQILWFTKLDMIHEKAPQIKPSILKRISCYFEISFLAMLALVNQLFKQIDVVKG